MSRGFLFGLFSGLLLGGLAGIFAAPQPGAGTRRMVSDATLPTRRKVATLVGAFRSRSGDAADEIRQAI